MPIGQVGLGAVGGRNLQLALQRDRVRVGVDQSNVVPVFFGQGSGDIEAECRSLGRCFDSGKSDMPHRIRLMPKEELLDQRMNLIGANRSRRRNCRALDEFVNGIQARLLGGSLCFSKKIGESAHGATTLDRPKSGR